MQHSEESREQFIEQTLGLLRAQFVVVRHNNEWICWPKMGKGSWDVWRFGQRCPEHIAYRQTIRVREAPTTSSRVGPFV
jgi:hypothetical protein